MWEQRIIEGEELWLTGPHEFFVQPKHHHLAQPDHFFQQYRYVATTDQSMATPRPGDFL